jgi:hypothetical protein
MVSRSACGSSSAITWWITVIGSRPSGSGHWAQRGCPQRSREEITLVFPRAAHGSVCWLQTEQYQCWPRRCNVRGCLPHSAQHGGEVAVAPARRRASSSSATARGAGDRPSSSTAGRSARAAARRRDLARPAATVVTTSPIRAGSKARSTAAISSTISPIGSATARSGSALAVILIRHRGCGPAWDVGRRCWSRCRPPSCSRWLCRRRRPVRSVR